MAKTYNPSTVAAPRGYSHGVELAPGARILYLAGQVGAAPDGTFARDITGQAEQAWRNIENVLAAAGMTLENVVKVTHYLTRKEDIAAYRAVRARVLGDLRPASTLLVISALASEQALIEIEAVAAK